MATARARQAAPVRDEDAWWQAVQQRDRSYDGVFVYAVRTTGIYCSPSCPSKRAKRSNVEFYTPVAAVAAGYRPCRRCRPGDPSETTTDSSIRRAIEHLESHLDEAVTLEALGAVAGMSASHLQRTFTERVGLSPKAYRDARRLERLRAQLRTGASVSRATYEAGFNSSRSVYERALEGLGMTPGTYRRGGQGLRIRYTVVDSMLGRLLVAATDAGVCSVSIGDDDDALTAELEREFPRATITRDDGALAPWAAAVATHAAGGHAAERPEATRPHHAAIPLDLHGTVFQLRVWQALREIPPGETRSYREVAAAIGQPTATRAVARACATNRAALLVPCHRVVRADGDRSGYRWGPERKRRLLELEAATATGA